MTLKKSTQVEKNYEEEEEEGKKLELKKLQKLERHVCWGRGKKEKHLMDSLFNFQIE